MKGLLIFLLAIGLLTLTGCEGSTRCGVQFLNEAAGTGSMQKLAVKVDEKLRDNQSVEILDPLKQGLVGLTMMDATLARLPNGEQSSSGQFKYGVRVGDRMVMHTCAGETEDCASEIAHSVVQACQRSE